MTEQEDRVTVLLKPKRTILNDIQNKSCRIKTLCTNTHSPYQDHEANLNKFKMIGII